MQAAGVQQLELDLRDNLGGLFMEGVEVARLFLPGTAGCIPQTYHCPDGQQVMRRHAYDKGRG